MNQLLQIVIYVLLSGAMYAIVSVGFYLALDVVGIINLAHGELILIGAYGAWWMNAAFQLEPLMAVIIVLPLMFVLGYITYYLPLYQRVHQNPTYLVVASLALSIMLRHLFPVIFSNNPLTVDTAISGYWQIGAVVLPIMRSVVFGVAGLVIVLLFVLLNRTRIGKSLRCVAQNAQAAYMIGIEVDRMRALTLALAFALAGLSGVLLSPVYTLSPTLGQWLTLKCVAVVFLAWRRGLVGVVVSAMILALLETIMAIYIEGIGTPVSQLGSVGVIFVVIVLRWRTLSGFIHGHA